MSAKRTTSRITRVELKDGKLRKILPNGRRAPIKDKTDWKRLEAMTDEEVERAAKDDPDAQPLTASQLKKMRRVSEVDVRTIRHELGMSQRAFAHKYGFTVDAVQDWEQGRCPPSRSARVLLAVIAREPAAVDRALRAAPVTPSNARRR